MPAPECCKLVKEEIPAIDDDLYSYIESKYYQKLNFNRLQYGLVNLML